MTFVDQLTSASAFMVRQRQELAELFGFETRNKYEVVRPDGQPLAFVAEQQKGLGGFLLRQVFGHWRSFEIKFFSPEREPLMTALHPFRFFFQRLEVRDATGHLQGALEQRFSPFFKSFDVLDATGHLLMTTRSPFWSPWTFTFLLGGREVAVVKKRWSGLFKELMTDADNFLIQILDPALPPRHRALLLAAAIFIDLQYFERKAGEKNSLLSLFTDS